MSERRVLFACDLDSQAFGALPLALAFQARGWRVTFEIDAGLALPKAVADRLAGRFELIESPLCALATAEATFDHHAVGVFATGSRIATFRHVLALASRALGRPRPRLFCGFNGLVYEKFEEGVAWRLGYDQLCLNGPRDLDAFREFAGASAFAAQPTTLVGLRRRPPQAVPPRPAREAGARRRFVFAEQVVVPADLADRRRLVAILAGLARRSPGWDVVVKARVRPDERTFHEQVGHIERLVSALPDRPANLSVSYEALDDELARADLFGTISSTALFDAFDTGAPSLVAADFGVRNAYGSHVFVGSGLMTALGELGSLDDAPRRPPDPAWLERVGYGPGHSPDALVDRMEIFEPTSETPPAFYSFEAAARSAAPWASLAEAILSARREVEDALDAGDDDAARRSLTRLGAALSASDRQRTIDASWRLREGRVAAASRKLGIYWLYKRARTRLIGEVPR